MKTARTPLEAITSILPLIPGTEGDFLDELKKCQTTASYAAPELYREVFARATIAVQATLGPPPLSGWKEKVRAMWMGES